MKPSDAALKLAKEFRGVIGGPSDTTLELAARIDAAADEKYAELIKSLDGLSRTWLLRATEAQTAGERTRLREMAKELRDALRKIKGEK